MSSPTTDPTTAVAVDVVESLSNLSITSPIPPHQPTELCTPPPSPSHRAEEEAAAAKEGEDEEESEQEPLDADEIIPGIEFVNYRDESQLDDVMRLVGRDLSEPYSVFTYRYFLHRFPDLCIFAVPTTTTTTTSTTPPSPIGCVVCKIDTSSPPDPPTTSGYMAMLAVDTTYRRSGVGTALVKRAVRRMRRTYGCTDVTLETEVSNRAAMRLYEERLGFVREELLVRYYLNWGDAYRLRLWLK